MLSKLGAANGANVDTVRRSRATLNGVRARRLRGLRGGLLRRGLTPWCGDTHFVHAFHDPSLDEIGAGEPGKLCRLVNQTLFDILDSEVQHLGSCHAYSISGASYKNAGERVNVVGAAA